MLRKIEVLGRLAKTNKLSHLIQQIKAFQNKFSERFQHFQHEPFDMKLAIKHPCLACKDEHSQWKPYKL